MKILQVQTDCKSMPSTVRGAGQFTCNIKRQYMYVCSMYECILINTGAWRRVGSRSTTSTTNNQPRYIPVYSNYE